MDPPWPSSEEEAEGGEGLPRQPVGSLVPQPLGAEVFRFRLLVHFVCSRRARALGFSVAFASAHVALEQTAKTYGQW